MQLSHIHNTKIAERTGLPPLMDLIIIRRNSLFGHVDRLGKDTPAHQALQHQIDISLGRLPDHSWKRPPCRSPKKQVHGSDSLWQQSPACWSMEMCYPSRSFCSDATVPTTRWRWRGLGPSKVGMGMLSSWLTATARSSTSSFNECRHTQTADDPQTKQAESMPVICYRSHHRHHLLSEKAE